MIEIKFPFKSSQRELFRSGQLIDEWAKRYPNLFDERDLEITKNQTHYHFFEWLGAVLLYEATGYLSLIEKYETKSHTRKLEIFEKTVSQAVFEDVLANRTGVPDLFVYAPDYSDWFFCEIKGLKDLLRPHQLDRLEELKAISGKDYGIMQFQEIKL